MNKEENPLDKCQSCQHCYTRQDDDYIYCRRRDGQCVYKEKKPKKNKSAK